MNDNDIINIKLDEVGYSILKYKKITIFLIIIGIILGTAFQAIPLITSSSDVQYVSTASIAVISQKHDGLFSSNNNEPNYQDVYLAEKMVDSVIYVCTSHSTLKAAADRINLLSVSPERIEKALTLSQYEESQIIEIKLVWNNKDEAIQILSAITEVVPDILINSLKIGSVTVVDQPRISGTNVKTFDYKWVLIFGLVGGVFGLIYSFLILYIHPTLLDTKQTGRLFGLECFGEIPEDRSLLQKQKTIKDIDLQDRSTEFYESITSVALILSHVLETQNQKYIYITSSVEEEGKTSVISNLALSLAKIGKKVLVIDFDLRNPSLGGVLLDKAVHENSLNAVYYEEKTLKEAVVQIHKNLDLLPTLLENKKIFIDDFLCSLVKNSTREYDFVIMDAGPVGQVSETMMLNKIADKALFVIKYDKVWIDVIKENIEKLRHSGITVLGCIVNGVNRNYHNGSSYYYREYTPYKERIVNDEEKDKRQNKPKKKKKFSFKKKNN